MPSVDQVLRDAEGGVGCNSGLARVGDVIPEVLARYGFALPAADRQSAPVVLVNRGSAGQVLVDCLSVDRRSPWEMEVAC
jgi:hypothetical protein